MWNWNPMKKVFPVHLSSIHPSIYPSLPHGAMCGWVVG